MNDAELEKMSKDTVHKINYGEKYSEYSVEGASQLYILEALRAVRDSVVTLPSKKEFEIFLKNTPHKKDQEAIDAIWDWLRSKLKPVQKGKFCPCGGIILADTEEFRTPLCCECYEEVLRSQTVHPISEDELEELALECGYTVLPFKNGYRAAKARDATDDRLNEIEIKHLVWDAGFVGEEWAERGESMNKAFKLIRAAEARILGGKK